MKNRVVLKREEVTMILSKPLIFLFIILVVFVGCKKPQSYGPTIPYNITIDTATLKIKVTNPPLASGIDVTEPSTKVILYLFDSKNLFISQSPYNGILTEDTSIVLNGLPMGHYTALLVVDGPGITNLNYLTKGVQSYQEVVDTLQYLLTDTYVGSSQNMVVNQKENVGNLKMEPIFSIISQVTFDLKKVATAWQSVPQQTDGLALLLFQNGTYVRQFSIPDSAIKKSAFSIPIAQGANYSFLFVDMIHQNEVCVLPDSLKKGESTISNIQTIAERYNNNIRMGMVGAGQIPQPTTINLTKTIVNLSVENCMEQVTFTFPTDMKDIPKPANSDSLVLLEFQNDKLVRQIPVSEDSLKNASLTIQVLKGNNYSFMVVDLLKEKGKFYLSDFLKDNKNTITINDIQSRVEPYNQNMRMGAIESTINLTKNSEVFDIINGLVNVSFDLSNLASKPLPSSNQTDGFALLEFKDGILIKQINIPYNTSTTIPYIFTTSVVKSTNYSFVFADLLKTTNGAFALKDKIELGKTKLEEIKDWLEPYLNQDMRMGSIAIANLNNPPTNNPVVNSLIQPIKIKFAGSIGCNDWSISSNWAILVHDHTGKYKRTFITNEPYATLQDKLLNVWVGNQYTISAIGNFGTTLSSEFTKPTTTYDTLKKYIPLTQSTTYAWLASDAGITTDRVDASNNVLTITANTTPSNPILSFVRIEQIPLSTIPSLRAKPLNYNDFACNPIRIEGIVTSDGTGENDIKNIIILQDKSATTNAAIPIQFTASTGLKKGDKVTIAIRDGKLVNNNPDASNMLVLQGVTYTKDPTIAITPNQSVTTQSLGNISGSTVTNATTMAQYEAMVVSISNVEFRYWKGQTFYDVQGDSIQLRDASVLPTTLPSARARFRLKMNILSPTEGFGFVPIPAGKGSVTGILAKNSSNRYAIQPRNASDINFTNVMTDRVDKGVVVDFNPNANNGALSGDKTNGFTTNIGVSRENPAKLTFLGSYVGYGAYNTATPGPGFYTNIDNYSATTGILLTLSTIELTKNEDVQISVSGGRQAGLTANASDLKFKVQYSIDNGSTWNDVLSSSFTFSYSSFTSSFPSITNVVIPGIGGNPNGNNVQVKIQYVEGRGGTGLANVLSWRQIKLNQF